MDSTFVFLALLRLTAIDWSPLTSSPRTTKACFDYSIDNKIFKLAIAHKHYCWYIYTIMKVIDKYFKLIKRQPKLVHIHRTVFAAQKCSAPFAHHDWALILFDYTAEVTLDDELFQIRPGYACLVPPGVVRNYFIEGPSTQRVANLRWESGERTFKPIFFDYGDRFQTLRDYFDEILCLYPEEETRVTIKIWDLIWELFSRGESPTGKRTFVHPSVLKARQWIEANLSEPIIVGDLAKRAGLSNNHLTRLFRQYYQTTPVAYIRSRRTQLAKFLLENTNMPVKSVACQVGLPDPHHFNKVMKKEFGKPPTALRWRGNYERCPWVCMVKQ